MAHDGVALIFASPSITYTRLGSTSRSLYGINFIHFQDTLLPFTLHASHFTSALAGSVIENRDCFSKTIHI